MHYFVVTLYCRVTRDDYPHILDRFIGNNGTRLNDLLCINYVQTGVWSNLDVVSQFARGQPAFRHGGPASYHDVDCVEVSCPYQTCHTYRHDILYDGFIPLENSLHMNFESFKGRWMDPFHDMMMLLG